MKINTIIKIILCLFVYGTNLLTNEIQAQTSGDRLFSQGLELQKIQTVSSQRSAITKFTSAKKLYDSAAKQQQCDDAIVVSNNIIKTLSKKEQNHETQPIISQTKSNKNFLKLSSDTLFFGVESRSLNIEVDTNVNEWKVEQTENSEESFLSINVVKEKNVIEVTCLENTSTNTRLQDVVVSAGKMKVKFCAVQNGKPLVFSVSDTMVEFKSKGGDKHIEVYCNSDESIVENNQMNWSVISKPDWVSIVGENEKSKGAIGKTKDFFKNTFSKSNKDAKLSDTKTTIMTIVADSKDKKEPSRKGDIIIESGDQRIKILVLQK